MIAADDPRHGTQAGAVAHWRSDERPCGPCQTGALRAKKRRQMDQIRRGEPANVRLGEAAHTIIASTNRKILSSGTGVGSNQLRVYELDGPDRIVRWSTRDKILAFRRPWTPVGIQRRLRALTLLGWSMQAVADRTGIYMTSLAELRRNESIKFVRLEIAEKILTAWDDLCMTPAPDSHSSRETAARAAERGWMPGLAWDDIDDPEETPDHGSTRDSGEYDEVTVLRVLAGDSSVHCTVADRVEIVRRWRLDGRSLGRLEYLTGWKADRYYTPDRQQVAS